MTGCAHPWHTLPLRWRAPSCPTCLESHPSGCHTYCPVCLQTAAITLVAIPSFAEELSCEKGHNFLRREL